MDKKIRSLPFLNALGHLYRSAIRSADRDLARALEFEQSKESGARKSMDVRRMTVRLNRKSADRVREMLQELETFLCENEDPDAADAYNLTTVFHACAPCGCRVISRKPG